MTRIIKCSIRHLEIVNVCADDSILTDGKIDPAKLEPITFDGVKKRIIAVSVGMIDVVMFNPVIVKKSHPFETKEGCLSLEGVRKTTRFQEITVEYQDMNFKKQRTAYQGWTARIIQHEVDHLAGIII